MDARRSPSWVLARKIDRWASGSPHRSIDGRLVVAFRVRENVNESAVDEVLFRRDFLAFPPGRTRLACRPWRKLPRPTGMRDEKMWSCMSVAGPTSLTRRACLARPVIRKAEMDRTQAIDAIKRAQRELDSGLLALRSVVSANIYEDIHEVLVNQMNRVVPLLLGTQDSPGIHFCDRLFEQLFDIIEAVRTSHQRALDIVSGQEPQPFCLYLRNFEIGRVGIRLFPQAQSDNFITTTIYRDAEPRVLATVAEVCGANVPVVGVHNLWSDRDARRFPLPQDVGMLSLGPDTWETYVDALIGSAHVIVLNLESLTDGVRWEVDRIVAGGHTSKTLVVSTHGVRSGPEDPSSTKTVVDAVVELATKQEYRDFSDVFGDMVAEFKHIALCGDRSFDLGQLRTALQDFLGERRERNVDQEARGTLPDLEQVFARALPRHLRVWAETGAYCFANILAYALEGKSTSPLLLAAAAAQGLVGYSFLSSDVQCLCIGFAVIAAIESLPSLRGETRFDGRSRGQLSTDNRLRSRHFGELCQDGELSRLWFERARSVLG